MKNPTIEKNLAESLKKFDNEGKEVIFYDELINIMTILGVKLIEEEVNRMIREEKAHIISDLKFIIGIIAFSVVVFTIILASIVANDIVFEIVGKVILLLWIVGAIICILIIIMGIRYYKKNAKIPLLIKEICSSINRS